MRVNINETVKISNIENKSNFIDLPWGLNELQNEKLSELWNIKHPWLWKRLYTKWKNIGDNFKQAKQNMVCKSYHIYIFRYLYTYDMYLYIL